MQVHELQLAKEDALASEDFETAITCRDAQRALKQQLSQIVEELLKGQ
jgi:protein-arginine kinase activator protein McsA